MKVTFIDLFELIFTYKLASYLQEKRFSVGPLSHRVMAFPLNGSIVGVPQGSIVGPLGETHTLPRNDLVISYLSGNYWVPIEEWEACPNLLCAPWRWSMCRFVVQLKKAKLNGLDKLFHLTFVVHAPVSEAAWDCSSQFTKSLFPQLKWFSILSLVTPSLLNWTDWEKGVKCEW